MIRNAILAVLLLVPVMLLGQIVNPGISPTGSNTMTGTNIFNGSFSSSSTWPSDGTAFGILAPLNIAPTLTESGTTSSVSGLNAVLSYAPSGAAGAGVVYGANINLIESGSSSNSNLTSEGGLHLQAAFNGSGNLPGGGFYGINAFTKSSANNTPLMMGIYSGVEPQNGGNPFAVVDAFTADPCQFMGTGVTATLCNGLHVRVPTNNNAASTITEINGIQIDDQSGGGGTNSAPSYIKKKTANGAYWLEGQNSELITLSTGGTTTDSAGNLLPANSLIKSAVCRVTTTITTATSWAVGDGTTVARFISADSTMTANETQVGLNAMQGVVTTTAAGPTQAAAAKLRITTVGTPGAGVIRCTVFYEQFVAPTS